MSSPGSSPVIRHLAPTRRSARAFTLIELLVVIGLIALTAGVLGLALRRDNSSTALQSAQGTVASLLAATRSEAALKGSDAALMIDNAPGDADRYLHALVIAVQADGAWTQSGDYVLLPAGAYVVPPTGAPIADGTVNFGSATSSASLLVSDTLNGAPHLIVRYTPLGIPSNGSGGNLVLSTATLQSPASASPILFNNAQNVRGLVLSAYGAVTFVNDASGFSNPSSN